MLNQRQKTNILLYVEVDVDICFDLYSFMKKHKRLEHQFVYKQLVNYLLD